MNVDANDLTDRVTVDNVGLGAEPGRTSSELDKIVENFDVVPLDQVVHGRVTVLKIDVEGMEVPVLTGARRILRKYHPVVFAEAWDEEQRAKIEATLRPYGYRATGKVFNSTPTYEFVFVGSPLMVQLRRAARKLPKPVRKVLIQVRDALRNRRG